MLKNWCEIFRAGAHTDSAGGSKTWTEADLDRIVGSYDPSRHEAPIVIGHPNANAPAFGWVETVKREGQSLFARFKQVLPEFSDMVTQGRFKKRSISLYPDGTLRHVGFLGAQPPAIKGLADFAFSDDGTPLTFEEQIIQEEQKHMPTIEELQAKLVEEATRRESAEKTAADAIAQVADLSKNFAEATAKAKKTSIEAYVDGLIATGQALPTFKTQGMVEFMTGLDDAQTFDFAEGKKENPLNWFKSFLSGLGTHGLFKDFSEGRKKPAIPGTDEEKDKARVEMILANAPNAKK